MLYFLNLFLFKMYLRIRLCVCVCVKIGGCLTDIVYVVANVCVFEVSFVSLLILFYKVSGFVT